MRLSIVVLSFPSRRFYHIVSFYLFFFNVILGLFSCLRRILLSLVFGLILISRLDRCLLMRGFERFDAGDRVPHFAAFRPHPTTLHCRVAFTLI